MFISPSQMASRRVSANPSPLSLLREALAEISSRQRLIAYLVQADMKKRGSDTVLGNLWWILDPLLQMVVYVVFVTILARSSEPDYPLFIFAAILPWKWYSSVVSDACGSVVGRAGLIRQIAFPKIVLPIAAATAGVVGFAWGLIPLLGLMLFYPDRISVQLAWLPVIAIVQYVFSIGTAILLAAANVFFRDLGNVAGHVLRLWWFLSPSLYSLATFDSLKEIKDHPILREIAGLNPFAVLFEAYRAVIYGDSGGGLPHAPDLLPLAELLVASLVFIALASIFFKRVEPDFAKVL
ncbi:MAG TPA: ABC transporter permease [Candidatus Limnocylindrales bacterium]|nr:ABC transporter permease [Candidatus Limnocylindrales bacterium]